LAARECHFAHAAARRFDVGLVHTSRLTAATAGDAEQQDVHLGEGTEGTFAAKPG
jgi:hypothetical protein